MPIPKAAKIAVGLVSSGGAIGGAIYGYTVINSTKIKETLKDTLIKEGTDEIWNARAGKLGNTDDSKLSDDLKEIKRSPTSQKIKDWCFKNIESKFSSEEDSLFKQIQLLCTYDIRDKITIVKDESGWTAAKNNEKLKTVGADVKLSDAMKEIKVKLSKQTKPETDALKDWCKATYDKPFKNEQDQEYLDAKEYCQAIT